MGKSTYKDFLTKMRTVIEGIDPNIGVLFDTPQIWRSDDQIRKAVVFNLNAPNLFDGAERNNKPVTRFWFTDVQIEPLPLTNCSAEYRTTITLTAFYQWEDDNSQEQTLRDATVEILDAFHDRITQNITLNTGEQYLGFLEERPKMLSGVEFAEIGDGKIFGHTARLQVTYFEEIPY